VDRPRPQAGAVPGRLKGLSSPQTYFNQVGTNPNNFNKKETVMVENRLDVGGAVVFWSLAEWSDRGRLAAGLAALGLNSLAPEPMPAPAALRAALEHVFGGPRVLVRPLASRDGFAVVREDRGLASNQYQTQLTARVGIGSPPDLKFDPHDTRALAVEGSYRLHLERVSAAQVSNSLVRLVETLGGTRLRPSGAVYWVPGHRLDDLARAARAVEEAADRRPNAVYVLRHRLDADAVRAVRDAVVAEVYAEAGRIKEEVLNHELGTRALETRQKQAAELREKVSLYEDLLSVGLKGLHRAVDEADQAAATAALMLSGSPLQTAGAGAR
jgi:hypothetical protein